MNQTTSHLDEPQQDAKSNNAV